MNFTLETEEVGKSYRARISTEGFSLALVRPTLSEAITRIGQVVESVFPILEAAAPTALVLDEPEVIPVTERRVVVEGDSDYMRKLLADAIATESRVQITYTDRNENTTTRIVVPQSVQWKGSGESPRRALIADDSQADGKTFYLDKIDRAEVI